MLSQNNGNNNIRISADNNAKDNSRLTNNNGINSKFNFA